MDNIFARRYLRERKWTSRSLRVLGVTTNIESSASCSKRNEVTTPSLPTLLESPDTKPYQFLPLDRTREEIRLLKLEPGSGDEMLRCTLEHAFLDSPSLPLYETISYVCGCQNDKGIILLHGHEVPTLKTSEAALRCMRLIDKPRMLWIDSVCINQHDDQEKGHQVGMMYKIYTKTTRNLIWMGPYNSTCTKAFDSLNAILLEIAIESQNYAKFNELLFTPGSGNIHSRKHFSEHVYTVGFECLRLFDNSWFSRLWVVQEAALAPLSVCFFGEIQITLIDILRSARWLCYKWYHLPWMPASTREGIGNAEAVANAVDRKHGLSHTLKGSAMMNCLADFDRHRTSNRKDTVFAILGLWQMLTEVTMLPEILKPDYKLSVCEIFTRATRFAIRESHKLAILELISEPPREDEGVEWPSWVPVLNRDTYAIDTAARLPGGYTSRAHNSTVAAVAYDVGRPNDLIVSGVLFNTVTLVKCAATSRMSASDVQIAIENLERPCHDNCEDQVEDLEEKISLVMIGGALRAIRVTSQDALSGYRDFKRYLQEHRKFPSQKDTPPRDYWASMRVAAWERAVFHTTGGHIGVGPKCCQPEDIVAILYGCSKPMVMRHLPEQGTFRILGASYVYGIMDGEAVRRHKEMGGEDTVFRIV